MVVGGRTEREAGLADVEPFDQPTLDPVGGPGDAMAVGGEHLHDRLNVLGGQRRKHVAPISHQGFQSPTGKTEGLRHRQQAAPSHLRSA